MAVVLRVVIFSSDNGGQLSVGANNGPLRDGKQSVYEGGIKVATCAAWYGSDRIKSGVTTDFRAMSMDLFPTMCDLAGATVEHSIEGRSIVPTLLGQEQAPLRDLWYFTRREGNLRYQEKRLTPSAAVRGSCCRTVHLSRLSCTISKATRWKRTIWHRRIVRSSISFLLSFGSGCSRVGRFRGRSPNRGTEHGGPRLTCRDLGVFRDAFDLNQGRVGIVGVDFCRHTTSNACPEGVTLT